MPALTNQLEIGAELAPRSQQVTQKKISEFHESFGGSNPIHTDASAAVNSGLEAPLQHAARTIQPVYSMLVDYSPTFIRGGKLRAKFISPVFSGDLITSHCRLINRRAETADFEILEFEIWAENQHGKTVFIGTASVEELHQI